MGIETELKFRVPLRRLKRVADLSMPGARPAPWVARQLTSTYYDTAARKLQRAGLVLRVREADGQFVQTVKSLRPDSTARGEWETPVAGGSPDLANTSDTPLKTFKRRKLAARLQPVFATKVQRTARLLRFRNSEIELAIDRGRIDGGAASQEIAEVEIELKKGDVADLFRLARLLAGTVEAELDLQSKSAKGFALVGGGAGGAVGAEAVVLDPAATSGDAFRVIALSAFRQVTGNADGVRAGQSEAVHQMRVGLRRLRAAIALFTEVLPAPRLARIKTELRWLTNELAAARELDVFIRERIDALPKRTAPPRGLRAFRRLIDARREAAFARARRAVASARYRALLIDVLEWIETLKPRPSDEPVARFGPRILARRAKKARKRGRDLAALGPGERHKLRIAIKKIRYGIEFMQSLYTPGARKRLQKASALLKLIQSALGELNDFRAHRKLAADAALTAQHDRRALAFSSGLLVGQEQEAARRLLDIADKAFAKLKPLPKADG